MRNRGLTEYEEMRIYLHGTRQDLHDPHLLKDVDLAAEIIAEKIKGQKRIRIIGDYDIDGIQATYILLTALKKTRGTGGYGDPGPDPGWLRAE